MIWLTWRQFRAQAIAAAILFVALGAVLACTGPHLVHVYDTSGIAQCRSSSGACNSLIGEFDSHFALLHNVGALLLVVPAIVGAFWGAPLLARELESGTYRVAWTQGITRTHWLLVKVVMVGAACVLVTGAFTAITSWWANPIDLVHANRFTVGVFSERGIVPAAYALFVFALALAAGAVLRRTLPAMAIALAGFFIARVVVTEWVRAHFATPIKLSLPLFDNGNDAKVGANSWVFKTTLVDRSGHAVDEKAFFQTHCRIDPAQLAKPAIQSCADRFGLHNIVSVQPANRFWTFQLYESALFVVAALALIGLSFWWVRRRLA
jgi:hypothetical protein